jgi:hypothetical protein
MLLPTLLLPLALLLTPGAAPQGDKAPQVKLTEKEQAELKARRDLADVVLRKAAEQALKNLEKVAKDDKLSKAQVEKLKADRAVLELGLGRPRFFESGTTPQDLLEFQAALQAADKLGVQLDERSVQELLKASVQGLVDDKGLKAIQEEVRKQQGGASAEAVLRALRDEFRARIVRELAKKKK